MEFYFTAEQMFVVRCTEPFLRIPTEGRCLRLAKSLSFPKHISTQPRRWDLAPYQI